MRILSVTKDGGEESTVWAYWLIEIKSLFSIALLCFENGSRDAYHTHAFNSISWLLWGHLEEEIADAYEVSAIYSPGIRPIYTRRETFHKVTSYGRSWVLTFRGPWVDSWRERVGGQSLLLTNGRKVLSIKDLSQEESE